MNTVAIPTREQIDRLQAAMACMPQVEMITNHYWAGGMYCRELFIPAGTLVVGKVHKREHFFLVTKGTLKVVSEFGDALLTAPSVVTAPAGIKRAGVAITDVVCCNLHVTVERDLDKLEKELVEDDPTALFDARNELKRIRLEGLP
jgi:hypothetical protein